MPFERRRPDVTQVELIGGLEERDLTLAAYDPTWPGVFAEHRARILEAISHEALLIAHIGSTSVPGLAAKPIIDVLLMVTDITAEEDWLPGLVDAGYELRVREPGHRMVRTPARDVHVHILERGDPAARDYLLLRDQLRSDSGDRERYARTKRDLVASGLTDMNAYAEAKGEVIAEIKHRSQGLAWGEQDYACVALIDPRGRILMQERDGGAPVWPERWCLPGGGIEAGEGAAQAAVREVAEEAGVDLAVADLTPLGSLELDTVLGAVAGHFFAVRVALTDADVVCHEGRQMVFVEPEEIGALPLVPSTRQLLPEILAWSATHPPALGENTFAGIFLVDRRGWILMQERDEFPRIDPDKWGLAGGHVEPGESYEAAAARELEEETGVVLPAGQLRLWREFVVDHRASHGTWDAMAVFVADVDLTDADIDCREGRQMVFVDPSLVLGLDLSSAAADIVPAFLASSRWSGPRTLPA